MPSAALGVHGGRGVHCVGEAQQAPQALPHRPALLEHVRHLQRPHVREEGPDVRTALTLAVPTEGLRGGQRGEAVAGELEDAVPPGRGPRRAAQVPRGRRERRHDHAPLVRVELRGAVQQGATDGR